MRVASAKLQSDRREEILAAAQRCFARSGFHRASMAEICAEARMSPGGLYRYFPSKEAIIAGIAERDRADIAEHFRTIREAPDFWAGMTAAARHYFVERPLEEVVLCAEIMAESRRNEEVARIHAAIEAEVKAGLIELLRAAAARGELRADLDLAAAAAVLMALADGFAWRRAADPSFDAEAALPIVVDVMRRVLTEAPAAVQADKEIVR
jgi:TetR/AcrR family transcriptional repressor of uid operon